MNPNRIMIVEDEKNLLHSMGFTLRRHGYEVVLFSDGAKAIQAIGNGSFHYNLVITDIQMPGANGMEIIDALAHKAGNTPVLVITGHATAQVINELKAKNIYECLLKPFTIQELVNRVEQTMHPPASGNLT